MQDRPSIPASEIFRLTSADLWLQLERMEPPMLPLIGRSSPKRPLPPCDLRDRNDRPVVRTRRPSQKRPVRQCNEPDFAKIRCPKCGWQPNRESRWVCAPCGAPEWYEHGCFHSWNTFETRGRCPGCGHQWQWTACHACGQWSRHEEWYIQEPPSPAGV